MYTISVKTSGEEVTASGETVLDALKSLQKPRKIVGKTFISVSDGEKKYETMWFPVRAKRIFYKIAQPLLAENFRQAMK